MTRIVEIQLRYGGLVPTHLTRWQLRICFLLFMACLTCLVWADPVPRTRTGQPNFDGTWDFRTATPLEAPDSTGSDGLFSSAQARDYEKESEENWRTRVWDEPWADRGRKLSEGNRGSLIFDPENGRLPPRTKYGKTLTRKWRQAMDAVHTDNPEDRTVLERCIVSSSVPWQSSNFNNNIRIVQTLTRSDGLVYEYACHEGNHSLTAILRGSRLEDQW